MEFYKLGIGLGLLSAILAALYFLYSKLSHVKGEIEDLTQLLAFSEVGCINPKGGSKSVKDTSLSSVEGLRSPKERSTKSVPSASQSIPHATNQVTNQMAPNNLHGQITDPRSQGKVQISYEPSEGTEGNTDNSTKEAHIVLYGQGYDPVPDEVDNVSLYNIDNISEFPCDLSFANLGD